MSSAEFIFHFFFKKFFLDFYHGSNGLDPDQDRHFVSPDLVQTVRKGYQQKTTVAVSKERVKLNAVFTSFI